MQLGGQTKHNGLLIDNLKAFSRDMRTNTKATDEKYTVKLFMKVFLYIFKNMFRQKAAPPCLEFDKLIQSNEIVRLHKPTPKSFS